MQNHHDNSLVRHRNLDKYSDFNSGHPLTAVAQVYGGPGVGLGELQLTIEPPAQSNRGKVLSVGVPRIQIQQAISVLKIPGLLGTPDYTIICRLVSADRFLAVFGLGLVVALLSSYFKQPIPKTVFFAGEIDLGRRVRGCNARILENIRRSLEVGELDPAMTLILPDHLDVSRLTRVGLNVAMCSSLEEVVKATWPRCALQ